jgi:methyl-accepting chemotaxis protein
MKNFKISTRLFALISILSALLVSIGSLGLFGLSQSTEALRDVYENRTEPLAQLAKIKDNMLRNRLVIANSQLRPDAVEVTKNSAEVEANIAEVNQVWTAFMATSHTTEEAKLAKEFVEARNKLLQEGILPTIAAQRANDLDGASRLESEKIRPMWIPVRDGIDALIQLNIEEAKKAYEAAIARYHTIRIASVAAIAGGVLFAFIFGTMLVRGISRSLNQAVNVSKAVAQGDLTHAIHVEGKDEAAQLLTALSAMQSSLVGIVGQVRQGTDTIATASSQIAAGNMDLSSRTEEQASSLEETAASMEEITSTVRQNADNARQANQMAVSASSVAVKGGSVVAQVVDTMGAINASSKKIVDIISVIEGIAFQTNILALNAAVEAARAGEQGRGFAVVAAEVRNLAQRSAAAAKEIKVLIDDSVSKVSEGSQQVAQAGKAMEEIVDSVKRVTDIMAEITAASQEQSQGIEQVNQAITQMDQVTQQNAALVEEAAAAAASLQEQAAGLSQVVSVFQLDNEPARQVSYGAAPQRPGVSQRPAAPKQPPRAKPAIAAPQRQQLAATDTQAAGGDWETF